MLAQVIPEDIIEYGMIPEIVGRLPVITTLQALDEDALVDILTAENAFIRQVPEALRDGRVTAAFTDEALKMLAAKAIEHDTGAGAAGDHRGIDG